MLRGVRTTGGPVKDLRLGLGLLFLALLLTFYTNNSSGKRANGVTGSVFSRRVTLPRSWRCAACCLMLPVV